MDEFEKFFMDLINDSNRPEFQPYIIYNRDGDQLEIYWENVSYYGDSEHWRRGFTLMRAQNDDRIVGMIIFSPGKYIGIAD